MPAITPTDICNMALREIGAERISDYATAQSKEARVARDLFQPARRRVLEMAEWNGATKAGQLTQMEDTTPTFWAYAYEVPTDLIRLVSVTASNESADTIPYELGFQAGSGDDEANVQVVWCASNQAYAKWIFDQHDLSALSPAFHDVLAFELARTFAGALDRTQAAQEFTMRELRRRITLAKANEGQQDYPRKMAEGSWMGMRFGRYGGRSTFTGV